MFITSYRVNLLKSYEYSNIAIFIALILIGSQALYDRNVYESLKIIHQILHQIIISTSSKFITDQCYTVKETLKRQSTFSMIEKEHYI